jgi:4a-hydroxytetrahydrobiopterin dehydratase
MADLIKAADLKNRMKKIPEWELEKNQIERTFEFDDFADAIDFVNAVAEVADDEEHHPDIDIRYNKVRLVLSTHSKGGLTELDFGLAERIDTRRNSARKSQIPTSTLQGNSNSQSIKARPAQRGRFWIWKFEVFEIWVLELGASAVKGVALRQHR